MTNQKPKLNKLIKQDEFSHFPDETKYNWTLECPQVFTHFGHWLFVEIRISICHRKQLTVPFQSARYTSPYDPTQEEKN